MEKTKEQKGIEIFEQVQETKEIDGKEIAIRTFAVLGIIFVLFLLTWLLTRVIRNLPNSSLLGSTGIVSSLFVPTENISFTSEKIIGSGIDYSLTWDHINKNDAGYYTLSYSCVDGLYFKLSNTGEKINCDVPYQVSDKANAIVLIPFYSKTKSIDTDITLTYIKTDLEKKPVISKTTLTIMSSSASEKTVSNTTTTPTQKNYPAVSSPTNNSGVIQVVNNFQNPSGPADLSVRIISVGIIDPSTHQIIPSQYANSGNTVGVQFEIANIGGTKTGAWEFSAVLPTQTQEIFRSNSEPSLAPGDRIIFVLSFTNIAYKSLNTITITADPSNAVSESSETNNVATYQILTNVQYQNSNQYYYQTGQYYPYNNSNYYYDGQYQYPYYTNGYSTGGNYYPNYSYPSYSNSLYY